MTHELGTIPPSKQKGTPKSKKLYKKEGFYSRWGKEKSVLFQTRSPSFGGLWADGLWADNLTKTDQKIPDFLI